MTNDSGSGLFIDSGSGWELAGTIVNVALYSGQPGGNGGAHNALFGNSTYAVDLSEYASEINGIVPEPRTSVLLMGLLAMCCALSARCREE